MIGNYYKSCAELPLRRFIRCLVTGSRKFLVKRGWSTKEELEKAWENIFIEYLDLTRDPRHTQLLALMREVTTSNTRAVLVYNICIQLRWTNSPVLADQLRRMGFRYDFDLTDRVKLHRATAAAIAQANLIKYQAEQRQKDLERLQKGGKEVTESDYDQLLAELGRFQGYRLDPDKITVAEFAATVKRYQDHLNHLKKKKS